jgi:hypothetical protein
LYFVLFFQEKLIKWQRWLYWIGDDGALCVSFYSMDFYSKMADAAQKAGGKHRR